MDDLRVDLEYPRSPGRAPAVEVNLVDTRAADGLRIAYDFDRDGWVVQQPVTRFVDVGEDTTEWREVGFFKAWALGAPPHR